MKHASLISLVTVAAALTASDAQITIPGSNPATDGALSVAIGESLFINLAAAKTGHWEDAGDGFGVYDPEKWAVVFKYSSIDIAGNVFFSNHPSGAPVIWLVDGDVNILGSIYLNGQNGGAATFAEPGPGGFRGANYETPTRNGFGPGGAGSGAGGGGYGTPGTGPAGGRVYGTAGIVPLIGGSGGSGGGAGNSRGGAGGGAISIIAKNGIYLHYGSGIYANGGGAPGASTNGPGGGSGGAIRLVADVIDAVEPIGSPPFPPAPKLEAKGGTKVSGGGSTSAWTGGFGRIRTESNLDLLTIPADPPRSIALVGPTARIWPDPSEPSIRAVALGNKVVPQDPRGLFTFANTDIQLSDAVQSDLIIEAANIPLNSTVQVRLIPITQGSSAVWIPATFVSGSYMSSTWNAPLPVTDGISSFTVTVTLP
jgi:hypothetical protein